MWYLNCLIPISLLAGMFVVICCSKKTDELADQLSSNSVDKKDVLDIMNRVSGRKSYPTDTTDDEWDILEPHFQFPILGAAGRNADQREILDAILYKVCTGCPWNMLPHDFPPTKTVATCFKKWSKDGTWERICRLQVHQDRIPETRNRAISFPVIHGKIDGAAEKQE